MCAACLAYLNPLHLNLNALWFIYEQPCLTLKTPHFAQVFVCVCVSYDSYSKQYVLRYIKFNV